MSPSALPTAITSWPAALMGLHMCVITNPGKILHKLPHGVSIAEQGPNLPREQHDIEVHVALWRNNIIDKLYTGASNGVLKKWNILRTPENVLVENTVSFDHDTMSGAFSPDFINLLVGNSCGKISILSCAPFSGVFCQPTSEDAGPSASRVVRPSASEDVGPSSFTRSSASSRPSLTPSVFVPYGNSDRTHQYIDFESLDNDGAWLTPQSSDAPVVIDLTADTPEDGKGKDKDKEENEDHVESLYEWLEDDHWWPRKCDVNPNITDD
ncbi:hypothetical protein AJ79_08641 [Helicocarpus griseus UAMH5409]|uniref:Uncharacterized protein n=1 Tax=Helicocarpus griseus UAMH5409 TaxID=1447875 RepID=A0A2B7WRV7_9EURO|nr:hypothetical protein AJ79_08641 [Helicocarpus griseus UAMH5409]